jgi:hypothetical protein
MKKQITILKRMSLLAAAILLLSACASTTLITSIPPGAKVYINDQPAGKTPYTYSDTKIVGSTTYITLEKEGYAPYNTVMVRNEEVDVGAVIGGFICTIPWLWIMKYQPEHTYELIPLGEDY